MNIIGELRDQHPHIADELAEAKKLHKFIQHFKRPPRVPLGHFETDCWDLITSLDQDKLQRMTDDHNECVLRSIVNCREIQDTDFEVRVVKAFASCLI